MSQQLPSRQSWRGSRSERLWLSALIDAMEQASRSDQRGDSGTLAALRAQLALPAQPRFASPAKLLN